MYVQLEDIRNHLNILGDSTLQNDYYLTPLEEAATQAIENEIERPLCSLVNEDGELPAPLHHAALLLIGSYYNNREAISSTKNYEIPLAYQHLIYQYKDYNAPVKNKNDESGNIDGNTNV